MNVTEVTLPDRSQTSGAPALFRSEEMHLCLEVWWSIIHRRAKQPNLKQCIRHAGREQAPKKGLAVLAGMADTLPLN